jgi:hypothetical protein
MINLTTTNIIFLSSETKIKNKKVTNEDDNTSLSYLSFFISLINIMSFYIGQVWYSLSDVNKGNTEVIIKKVHHSVERQ